MNEALAAYYEKGYRSIDKLFNKLKSKGFNPKRADVQRFIDSKHIRSRVKKYNKSLMGNKFSSILDTWQIDTYTTERYKTNYLIAINVNTRYAWCRKRKDMSANDFIDNIKHFIEEMHPRIIECDDEKSFNAYPSVRYLQSQHIIMKVYPGTMQHESLSIINKFCRTLRVESREYDEDPPIEAIIKRYNKSHHRSIGMEPRAMQFNRDKEIQYISKQLSIRDAKNKLSLDDPIEKGDKVRYIRDEDRKANKFAKDKMKYQLSKYYYLVEAKHSPLSYDIIAEDGSIKTIPRYKLYKLTPTEERELQFAPTLEDPNDYQVFDEIVDYKPVFKKDGSLNENKTKYTVRVISRDRDGKKLKQNIEYTIYQLRMSTPTIPTKLETEFVSSHSADFFIDKKTGFIIPK